MSFTANVEQRVVAGRKDPKAVELALEQLRTFCNRVPTTVQTLTTNATGAMTALYTSGEVPFDSTVTMQAKVHGRSDDGTVYATYEMVAMFYRGETGSVAQLGATQDKHTPIESNALLDADLVTTDDRLVLQVNDGGLGIVHWSAWIELRAQ